MLLYMCMNNNIYYYIYIFILIYISKYIYCNISSSPGHKWKQGMWSKEEIDLLMSNIDQYVKVRRALPVCTSCRALPVSRARRTLLTRLSSGPRHRRPGGDHLRDVQRGEEGLLPLRGARPEPAAVRRLQASPPDVRQPQPRREVSARGNAGGNTLRPCLTLFDLF